jgi:general secretion pathway protein A
LLLEISSFVIGRHKRGCTTVLVVDEAHHLSSEVLEEIRLLTNLETPEQKLIQILLAGQPELDDKLDSVGLRQLKQRIALRSCLSALALDETEGYVHRRLQLAGNPNPLALFPKNTVAELHQQSHGFPRLINTLCENGLIIGYARQLKSITPEIIVEVAEELRLNVVSRACVEESTGVNDHMVEVRQAARTLLDLYTSLRSEQESRSNLRVVAR